MFQTGLFHQIILQSGTDISDWAVNGIERHPEKDTKNIAQSLGCPTGQSKDMMDCLRTKDWRNITAIPAKNCAVCIKLWLKNTFISQGVIMSNRFMYNML